MESLVATDWLAAHLRERDVKVVDSSWHMPASGRNARDEYLAAHIPGAVFLDIDDVADKADPSPHAMPSAASFGAAMAALGVSRDDRIVVYDNSPLRTAARGWFMLTRFGAPRVAVLDGGFQKWLAEGRPTETGQGDVRPARFDAVESPHAVLTKKEILKGIAAPLVDARGKGRFEGTEPEPRPGVASGHIPGARNLPFGSLYREDGRLKPVDEIRRLFAEAGIDPERPFAGSCGSGVTATALLFAAHLLGNDHTRLYDGSWTEWGADPATPKALGPA